jgi:CRP-like cAMP-binding protein
VSTHLEALRNVTIFRGLPDEELERIDAMTSEASFEPGNLLIEAGHPGAGAFVILDGRVAVHARGVDTELGPGEVVGELALLRSDSKRIARVQALTHVECLAIDRSAFRSLLSSDVHLAIALLENLANRVPD